MKTDPKAYTAGDLICGGTVEAALREVLEILQLVDRPPIRDPQHQDRVTALGEEIGYGALMGSAEYAWRESLLSKKLEGGEFVAGPCRSQIDEALKVIRGVLALADD